MVEQMQRILCAGNAWPALANAFPDTLQCAPEAP